MLKAQAQAASLGFAEATIIAMNAGVCLEGCLWGREIGIDNEKKLFVPEVQLNMSVHGILLPSPSVLVDCRFWGEQKGHAQPLGSDSIIRFCLLLPDRYRK